MNISLYEAYARLSRGSREGEIEVLMKTLKEPQDILVFGSVLPRVVSFLGEKEMDAILLSGNKNMINGLCLYGRRSMAELNERIRRLN